MDSKRKRQLDERECEERALEECVLKILRHGDPNQLTESKVRKLAASETGFDLTDPANRKLVKQTVETYFLNYQQDGPHHEKAAQAKAVAHKTAALPSPKPERRRKLVTFDDDDDDEDNAEPAARGSRANGTKQSGDDEAPESEEEGEKRSSMVTTKKRADDKEDDEEAERVNRKKDAVHSPPKQRHLISDEEESDAEEKDEKSINGKNAASVRNKVGRKARDEEEEEEGERRGPRSLPERKKASNDGDTVCQLSKNRFVSVQDFKGKALVSIREYYEKDGKQLPTRKGISLTVDQWDALKEGIPDIEAAIQQLK